MTVTACCCSRALRTERVLVLAAELHASLDTTHDPVAVLVQVARHDALQHLNSMADAQVVYLAHPVRVSCADCGAACLQHLCTPPVTRLRMHDLRPCVQLAEEQVLRTQCLGARELDAVRQSAMAHWDVNQAPQRDAVLGRVVGGRLTLAGGLAPAPEREEDGSSSTAAPAAGWVGVRDAELPGMPTDGWPEQFAGPLTHRTMRTAGS